MALDGEKNNILLTLVSTSSSDLYPSNTQAHFKSHLHRTLNLREEDKWSIALRELFFNCAI